MEQRNEGADAPSAWRVRGLTQAVDEPDAVLRDRACQVLGIDGASVRSLVLARRSVDARKQRGRRRIRFECQVDLQLAAAPTGAAFERALRAGRVVAVPAAAPIELTEIAADVRGAHVAVIGAGPAGLFAALVLARNGARVTVIDRGACLRERGL